MNTFDILEKFYFHEKGYKNPIKDIGDVYEFEAELAGFSKKDLKISATDEMLVIKAEKDKKSKNFKIDLKNLVSLEHITCEMKDGLLKIIMPKKSVKEAINIKIN